jgi:hypothetical protein
MHPPGEVGTFDAITNVTKFSILRFYSALECARSCATGNKTSAREIIA